MTDRPILFSAPMVKAIMREIERPGTGKTQTRRMLKCTVPPSPGDDAWLRVSRGKPVEAPKHPHAYLDSYRNRPRTPENPRAMSANWCWWTRDDRQCLPTFKVGYVPGDRLWVRETFAHVGNFPPCVRYYATDDVHELRRKRPGIHMPRWASRLTLTVTDVRVQRLQDISEADAVAEGVMALPEPEFGGWYGTTAALAELAGMDPRNPPPAIRFAWLWNQINGERDGARWADNPWVVAVSFTPHLRNIDDTSASKVAA